MLIIVILLIIILVLLAASYYMFASVFDMKIYKHTEPSPDYIDSEKDLMRPTAHKLYAFQAPYMEKFKDIPYEDLYVTSFDGLKLHGYLYKGEGKEVVICVHGYKSAPPNDYADKMEIYTARKATILCIDDRAHGKSEGRYLGFSELDKYDIKSWVEKINELYDNPNIYLHGVSMGGASVIHTADMNLKNVKGIIDDCGYDTIDNIVRFLVTKSYHVPYFPLANLANMWAKLLAHVGFKDSIGEEIVAHSTVPIVFIHGKLDNFVPAQMSIDLYNACTSKKAILLVEDCGHAAAYCCAKKEYTDLVNKLMDGKIE